jgi:plasmid stability protein
MGVLVQIRDVPEDVHGTLKARAALAGVSLSEYVRGVLARAASRPTPAELSARVQARGVATLAEPSEIAVRRLRDHGE